MTRNVLIVEDDTFQAQLMKAILSDEYDLNVVLVTDNFQRLLNPKADAYVNLDVICCDISLTGGLDFTGVNILTLVKNHFPKIKRVALTGTPTDMLDNVADVVLVKVVPVDDIIEALL